MWEGGQKRCVPGPISESRQESHGGNAWHCGRALWRRRWSPGVRLRGPCTRPGSQCPPPYSGCMRVPRHNVGHPSARHTKELRTYLQTGSFSECEGQDGPESLSSRRASQSPRTRVALCAGTSISKLINCPRCLRQFCLSFSLPVTKSILAHL